ncbi:phosphatidylglycerol lysyltransferase domain-containing protein [Paludicola sp. MB14-C6]|uniref:DUF2156 domain-containing protein n=1 Tax=Paludihabitans sp. MB14-C6 TaxID=3070656 RepID=UPI0027DDD4D9|nr:phosphatidylglycerol lysyltransferase domain-containing protein [Paludicola sp. MB14-C6]WMJ23438.1 phosphatidylglycerol lysyltransferase domain-containing protein [Paludicola sp. MB14-C6]
MSNIEFKNITLEDKKWIDPIVQQCDFMSCEYTFGNNFIWKNTYHVEVANVHGFYVAAVFEDGGVSFLYPAGKGDVKLVIDELLDYCNKNNYEFHMHSLQEECRAELETLYPGKFIFEENRDHADYIYTTEDLINLTGKKYHGKRNHIRRFKDNNWCFEPITEQNIKDCMDMSRQWCILNDCGQDESKKAESCAVRRSFEYFKELNFFGGLLRVDGKVVAYTIAEKLNDKTVVVHIEKAFSDIQGAYPTINQEFVTNMESSYKYVNREEDLGVEGLRKAKLSYYPSILLTKYGVRLK